MEELTNEEGMVRSAALRGARSVTRSRQMQEDAVAYSMERWEEAVMRGKHVSRWEAWARRTGANAAKRLASRHRLPSAKSEGLDAGLVTAALDDVDGQFQADARGDGVKEATNVAMCRRLLRAHLAQKKNLLRGRQLEVVLKMSVQGMSFHRAAKELAMPRCNVRRSFRSAIRRLLQPKK